MFLALTEPMIAQRLTEGLARPPAEDCAAAWLSAIPRPAAVLIPFLWRCDEWHLLYTRRTEQVAQHKGQVAFPGGRCEPEDPSPQETALREAQEEIGLDPAEVRVLGCLHPLPTVTNYCVTPVIGVIPWPYSFHLQAREVSRVFTIPLAWLADPAHHEVRVRLLPESAIPHPVIYFQRYDDELLWGVSAQITLNLLHTLRI